MKQDALFSGYTPTANLTAKAPKNSCSGTPHLLNKEATQREKNVAMGFLVVCCGETGSPEVLRWFRVDILSTDEGSEQAYCNICCQGGKYFQYI